MNVSFWTRLWACIIQTLQHQSKQNWIFQIKTLYQLCQASSLSLSSIGMWVIIIFWQHIYKSFENMQLLHWSFLVFISPKYQIWSHLGGRLRCEHTVLWRTWTDLEPVCRAQWPPCRWAGRSSPAAAWVLPHLRGFQSHSWNCPAELEGRSRITITHTDLGSCCTVKYIQCSMQHLMKS